MAERGQPQAIRCDNGPELTSRHFLAWCIERQIELVHIQPGKPTQNGTVESFHGRLREECLSGELVSEPVRCAAEDRGVAEGVQRRASAQQLGLSHAERICCAGSESFYRAERGARDLKRRPLAPAPPSPLKPEMEQKKFVVFLRERKQGACVNKADGVRTAANKNAPDSG